MLNHCHEIRVAFLVVLPRSMKSFWHHEYLTKFPIFWQSFGNRVNIVLGNDAAKILLIQFNPIHLVAFNPLKALISVHYPLCHLL